MDDSSTVVLSSRPNAPDLEGYRIPTVERASVRVKSANGSEMEILGRFEADFAIYDRPTPGHRTELSPNPATFWDSNSASGCPTVAS
ncbi:unnamed protein product [Heligmosomoides polygyrus]|uniref:TDP43_N domain-containing protein n=1 Tax=Heligmosomoides polygyrus TaxID=6339 RepID=A0A183GU48_HELPZ|nr:unnamed protein product [Heligmosomoides polygyrus]